MGGHVSLLGQSGQYISQVSHIQNTLPGTEPYLLLLRNAYTRSEVSSLLQAAKEQGLGVIPLLQVQNATTPLSSLCFSPPTLFSSPCFCFLLSALVFRLLLLLPTSCFPPPASHLLLPISCFSPPASQLQIFLLTFCLCFTHIASSFHLLLLLLTSYSCFSPPASASHLLLLCLSSFTRFSPPGAALHLLLLLLTSSSCF